MIIGRQSGLGKGLGAIIPPTPSSASANDVASLQMSRQNNMHHIDIDAIDPNPLQPREHFDHAGMEELIASIKTHGILQPIIVSPAENGRYTLIAGERRWRAAKIADLSTVPALLRSAPEQQQFELALIENIQRKDLNALEEAHAYMRLQNEFSLTQEDVAQRVGKSRSHIANTVRLLQLPRDIQDALRLERISPSHARTLLSVASQEARARLFQDMLAGNFTVRQTEARVPHPRGRHSRSLIDPNLAEIERKLREALHTKVTVKRDHRGEGEVKVTFLNDEDLNSIVSKITSDIHSAEIQ